VGGGGHTEAMQTRRPGEQPSSSPLTPWPAWLLVSRSVSTHLQLWLDRFLVALTWRVTGHHCFTAKEHIDRAVRHPYVIWLVAYI